MGCSSIFLRTYGCNLGEKCPVRIVGDNSCDTEYSWSGDKYTEMSPNRVAESISNLTQGNELLIFTGGEPMIQEKELMHVSLRSKNDVVVETNGTIIPSSDWADYWCVSPKIKVDYKTWLNYDGIYFKFVCSDIRDFKEVDRIVEKYKIPKKLVWLMPEGMERSTLQSHRKSVAERALEKSYNYSDRLQIQIWGNRPRT